MFVEVVTIHAVGIIENSPFAGRTIDVLSIDAEGMDFRILQSVDFQVHPPQVILIEDYHKDIREILETDTFKLLASQGYSLRSWAFYTLIFVKPKASILKSREYD